MSVIRLIAAVDMKSGLAKNNHIPWLGKLPSDAKHFRGLTLTHGANVLMGRKTYEQMGSYLKRRHNFILTHQQLDVPDNVVAVSDLAGFISSFKEDLWVIGGAEVFSQTIEYASELHLTIIEADFDCDRFFPDYGKFKLVKSEGPFSENGLTFSYLTLTNPNPWKD